MAVLLLALVGLALWPPALDGEPGEPRDARTYVRKLGQLADALEVGQGAHTSLGEAELNARLDQILAENDAARTASGFTVALRDLEAELPGGSLRLAVRTSLLGLPLTFAARFAPSPGGEHPLVLRSLSVGHLPLLGPFRQLFARRLRALFAGVQPERRLFLRLDRCTYGDGTLDIAVVPFVPEA